MAVHLSHQSFKLKKVLIKKFSENELLSKLKMTGQVVPFLNCETEMNSKTQEWKIIEEGF